MPDGTDTGTTSAEGQPAQGGSDADQQQPATGSPAGTTDKPDTTPDYKSLYEQTLTQSRKWESRAKENVGKAKKWDDAEAANRTEAEKNAERAEQAETRAKSALTSAVNAEIRAAALGWANPADAPRYLDDKDRYVGEDGDIDTKAIAEDVAAVLKERPHLAASSSDKGRRGPNPDPSQGHRGSASVGDQIREAERKGDHREALRLKTEQLLSGKR